MYRVGREEDHRPRRSMLFRPRRFRCCVDRPWKGRCQRWYVIDADDLFISQVAFCVGGVECCDGWQRKGGKKGCQYDSYLLRPFGGDRPDYRAEQWWVNYQYPKVYEKKRCRWDGFMYEQNSEQKWTTKSAENFCGRLSDNSDPQPGTEPGSSLRVAAHKFCAEFLCVYR